LVDPVFLLVSGLVVATSILAIESRQLVYGAVNLALMFLAVAGMFVLLEAPFIAMFQVFVNVGAVAILVLFTVMLVSSERWARVPRGREFWAALGTSGLTVLALISIVARTGLADVPAPPATPSVGPEIGVVMLSNYGVALVVLGILLAASVIGAVALAKVERD
jgi:NADH:ubiquinone oxidoreductase subunit 6 (subunit J)